MVKGNLLSGKDLKEAEGDSSARDALLVDRFGFTPTELGMIRSESSLDVRIVSAARSLYRQALLVAPGDESSQITSITLAAIVSKGWDNVNTHRCSVDSNLRDRYPQRKSFKRFSLPAIHFLREEIGAYSGNLLDAGWIYKNFQASNYDFLKSVKLPLNITPEVSYMLGAIWASGHLSGTSGGYHLVIDSHEDHTIDDDEYTFPYSDTLPDIILNIFNLVEPVTPIKPKRKTEEVSINGRSFTAKKDTYARIQIGSKAIYTWLMDDVGLYTPEKTPALLLDTAGTTLTSLDIFPTEENWRSFLAGVIDSNGKLRKRDHPQKDIFYVYACSYSNNPNHVETINNLCARLGGSGNGRYDMAYISGPILRSLHHAELLRNPNHIGLIEESHSARR